GDLHPGSLLLGAAAADRVIDGDVVLQSICARDVVVVRVLPTPNETAGLIFPAGDRFELHLNIPVSQVGVVFEADWVRGLTRLLQDVRLAGGGGVLFYSPFRVPSSRLCCGPAGRRRPDGQIVKGDHVGQRRNANQSERENQRRRNYCLHRTLLSCPKGQMSTRQLPDTYITR